MNKEQALSAIHNGQLAQCSKEDYPEIRNALQGKAGEMVDSGDGLRAMMMLNEVKRLDNLHSFR